MRLYSAKVNLCNFEGHMKTEVLKHGLTASEIIILRKIHGANMIVAISPTGQDKRPHQAERTRLAAKYGEKTVSDLFGSDHNRLPVDLGDVAVPDDKSEAA